MLRCPLCEAEMKIGENYRETPEELIHGFLYCECDTYPVCEGILILKNSPTKKYVLRFLKEQTFQKATLFAMANYADDACRLLNFLESVSPHILAQKTFLWIVSAYFQRRYAKYFDERIPFLDLLGGGPYDQYLKHRFSSQTFWSLYPFLPLIRERAGKLLEVCCGSGHASFILSRFIPPERLIGIDGDFRNLYLAAKYFSRADFIQADMNVGLPFKDHRFSTVLMMDSLHYIDARALLAREIVRVTTPEGFDLVLHMHNALRENVSAGRPFYPSTIDRLFPWDDIKILPEQEVIGDYIRNGRLDLSRNYTEDQRRQSDALIVARHAPAKIMEGIWNDLFSPDDHLILNPMYNIEVQKEKMVMDRIWPSSAFRQEYPLTEAYLPDRFEIDKASLLQAKEPSAELYQKMRKNFTLLSVPENYGGNVLPEEV
jgi:SAM-dependent methyltransferase